MPESTKFLFLLGGSDLEMIEIKSLLEKTQVKFLDAGLSWNNSIWDAYMKAPYIEKIQQSIAAGVIVYGIELRGDIPTGCELIDHHNELQENPASIVQVANILNIKLNDWQQLVAANDAGYIPAMQALGASDDDISKIRKADREAQGVTVEDEALGRLSVEKNTIKTRGITIVKSLTERFSVISDIVYKPYLRLIIYNEKELNYYGSGKLAIAEKYHDLIKENKAYQGGDKKNGYFGLKQGIFSETEIKEIKNSIVDHLTPDYLKDYYSHHVFIFPFKWEHSGCSAENSLLERFNLNTLPYKLADSFWKRKTFKIDGGETYNEFNYFYGHVREILYDLSDNLKDEYSDGDKKMLLHYEYKNEALKTWKYLIKVKGRKEPFALDIDSILLNFYNSGVGVISFHLRNFNYAKPDDILTINQYGRRLYPPFFDLSDITVKTGNQDTNTLTEGLEGVKGKELPEYISIGSEENHKNSVLYEDFSRYTSGVAFNYGIFMLPKFINGLFPIDFWAINQGKQQLQNKEGKNEFKLFMAPILDSRMFVVCWYGSDHEADDLKYYYTDLDSEEKENLSHWWYKFLYVDAGILTCQDRDMRKNLIAKGTYNRWIDYGTIIGLSRYSFVMLTSESVDSYIIRHLQTMYYKMAELCLVQRATILNYADEVTHVSHLLLENDSPDKTLEKIATLYKKYLLFINKVYFKEITAQEQGIELYDLLQKQMKIPEDVIYLDKQIEELHNYSGFQKEKYNNELLTKIAIIGAIFLPLSLMASVMSFNVLPDIFIGGVNLIPAFWSRIGVMLLVSVFIVFILDWFSGFQFYKEKHHSIIYRWIIYLFLLVFGIALTLSSLIF